MALTFIRLPLYQGNFSYSITDNLLPDTGTDMVIPIDPVRLDGKIKQVFYPQSQSKLELVELKDPAVVNYPLSYYHQVRPVKLLIHQSAGAGVSVNTPERVNISYYIVEQGINYLTSNFSVRTNWMELGAPVPNAVHEFEVDIPDGAHIVGILLTFDINDDQSTYLDKPFVLKGMEFMIPDHATDISMFDTANPVGL